MWYDCIFKDQQTADLWNPRIQAFRDKYYGKEVVQVVNKLDLIDFDRLYEENKLQGAVLVPCGHDDETVAVGGSVNIIKKILFQSSDGNLNFIASCNCGHLRGNYNIGQTCPICKTKVQTVFADKINIHAWLEIPESLPGFLHPAAYRVLDKWMGTVKRRASLLDTLLNAELPLPPEYQGKLGQGMWYFERNFDDIIRFIMSTKRGAAKAKDNAEIAAYIEANRNILFVRHIPILDQSLHILTHSGSMTYNDTASDYILKTCVELGNTVYQQRHQPAMNMKLREQHVYSTYKSWFEYTESIIKDKLIEKTGFIRKFIHGSRCHHTARAVIVPITSRHMGDEVELPWRMIVGLMKLEIINRLKLKYGLDPNTAILYWQQAQTGYDEEGPLTQSKELVMRIIADVKQCLEELLAESPFKGFPILMGRNPTLRHGALQLFFAKHNKTDMSDDTVGMSPMSISAPNADYDGDALYLMHVKEQAAVIDFLKIHPMSTLLGGEGDGLTATIKMPDEMCISMHNYLTDNDTVDFDKYYQMIHAA